MVLQCSSLTVLDYGSNSAHSIDDGDTVDLGEVWPMTSVDHRELNTLNIILMNIKIIESGNILWFDVKWAMTEFKFIECYKPAHGLFHEQA